MSICLPTIESNLKIFSSVAIDLYVDMYGVDCLVNDPEDEGAYTDVYGNRDGDEVTTTTRSVRVLLTGDLYNFYVTSGVDIGFVTDTNVYVKSGEVLYNGSRLNITKNDGITYAFRVQHPATLGLVDNVTNRYKVVYIEE